jgi:hypothetical protein
MADAKTHSGGESTVAHEPSDPKLGPVVRFGLLLALLSIITMFVMQWMFDLEVTHSRAKDAPLPPLASERQVPADPRLQSMPGVPLVGEAPRDGAQPFSSESYADFKSKESESLSSYGWVDRQAGIVRIPIDRAMELVLKKGLPSSAPKSEKH